jgi:formylglycine-generating enzyme required for sulfatase activity
MILAAAMVLTARIVSADVFNMGPGLTNLQMVPVGNPGNAPDTLVMNDGTTGYGPVGYAYSISKCEITAGQYAEFLNAVAGTSDPYGLYNGSMALSSVGSIITKTGSGYMAALPNQPVNYVSWGDAARFCNWLQTGTTENGAYTLGGHSDSTYLMTVTRNAGATYVIPTEDEWYKAAYYDPNKGGLGVGGYWLYPTKSNTAPSNVYPSTSTNNANYSIGRITTLSSTPWTTEVGSFANSLSAYGTLDQGGNLWEWNETALPHFSARGMRGGSFTENSGDLISSSRNDYGPASERSYIGFRVAYVPEPGSIILTVSGAIAGLMWWRCRR